MTRWLISLLLQGFLLPLAFAAGAVLRQNGQSAIYLLFLFINPLVPVPTSKTMAGCTGVYQKIVIIFAIINILALFSFQIVLASFAPYGSLVTPACSDLERYLRYAGFVRLDELKFTSLFDLIAPEFIVTLAALLVHMSCIKLNPGETQEQLLPITETQPERKTDAENASQKRRLSILVSLGKYVCLMAMFFAGSIEPSALNGVYFIVFLGSMTWWACNKTLGKPFAYTLRLLMLVVAGHVGAIFIYQMQWAQEMLAEDSQIARYLGLRALYTTSCDPDPRVVTRSSFEWDSFINPLLLLLLYYIMCFESKLIINVPGGTRERDGTISSPEALTEATPLIRGRESLYRKKTPPRRGIVQDAMGSVTITEVHEDESSSRATPAAEGPTDPKEGNGESFELEDIAERQNAIESKEPGSSVIEVAINACIAIAQFIAQSSYIATNIIMMTWSITYHSWITFVLLLWASLMWLVPNQRKAMLRSSPFLVFYATVLLLAQYIYGMDLTESELPSNLKGVNLGQIGFVKVTRFPVQPLLFKTLFTIMFWITLKQYNQEKWDARNQSALADIAAPLQIGVGTAAGLQGDAHVTKADNFIRKIGSWTRRVLTKFWIWVVASILFTIGMAGERMTIFRILYMGMALLFILTFQLSWTLWRKLMYGFWLVLIIMSMLILICTYTYQFDNFDNLWEEYLLIPKPLQKDIGLERYETTELFVKLLTPTFFVIITVIQLYYFHDDFLAISDIKSRGTSISGPPPKTQDFNTTDGTKEIPLAKRLVDNFWHYCDLLWLFLELHLLKAVILSLALLAIYDVCAAHFAFVLFSVIGVMVGSRLQTMIAHFCSVLISLLIITKMIYQINYIDHNSWNATCEEHRDNATVNVTGNSAEWFGFQKTSPAMSLSHLLRGYIGVLLTITFHAVVVRRQKFHRHEKGRTLVKPAVMFPRISYLDVDRDTVFFLKYILNYGFYRFGVEITLISIVALVGFRMDFYASLYAVWLLVLITPNRKKLSRLWPLLTVFIVFTIPLQYTLAVGFPPDFCIDYPWNSTETLSRFRDWMFLPDQNSPPPVHKLLCDFVVLMFACRQGIVFRIEWRNRNNDFPGGSNKPIIHHFEQIGFVNPVPDFISSTKSLLDVIKRVTLPAFYWVTLAVFFLAGTNRVNLFSLGYLIGAFIFLWHGNDFYLRPIRTILRWWNYLIIYNVIVIFTKTLLQILGCIFINELKDHVCWLVQLLGIACIRKFTNPTIRLDYVDIDQCAVPTGEVGLAWDFCCFGFLILQRRLFCSYYFLRIINEAKAMTVLASRGAELIEELSQRRVQVQMESENKLLEKIKNKMDRIKASQKKIQGPNYKEPTDHFAGDVRGSARPARLGHKHAVRSGDYYMFDDYEDDLDLISEKSSDSVNTEFSDEQVDIRRSSLTQFISKAMKSDIRAATGEAKARYLESKIAVKESHIKHPSGEKNTDTSTTEPSTSASTRTKEPPGSSDDDDESSRPPAGPPRRALQRASSIVMDEEVIPKPSIWEKIWDIIKFSIEFLNSGMVSITRRLNKTSRDYRYVMKTLALEKRLLLGSTNFGVGHRPGKSRIWRPLPNMLARTTDGSQDTCEEEMTTTSELQSPRLESGDATDVAASVEDDGDDDDLQIIEFRSPAVSVNQFEEGELSASDQPPIIRLIIALWYAVLSHSDLVCYFVVFIHQIRSPTLLSLPLPLMVFFWGTLTVPRPSKRFWVTIIAYTEVVVVVKCMFQFEMLPWNRKKLAENAPFSPARIIGVEREPGTYAYLDLVLLLVVFFHRAMLKSLGLWKTTSQSSLTSSMTSDSKKKSPIIHREGSLTKKSPGNELVTKEYFPVQDSLPLSKHACVRPFQKFFRKLLKSRGRVTTDVYAYMFFCDFFNFIVVIFGFASFGSNQGDGGVSQYFEENKVPVAFLVMLILQFALIIVDRTLYLRKYILGKLIYQYILVFGIHIWMFFILPAVTQRQFNAATPPQMWYVVKCIYLLLSAYQIRCGYPTRIYGNFLCKGYNYINYYLFKIFMAVPFVFELRALMDWIWTDTSMTLSDWLKMEDIFAHVFQLKCQRRAEREYPQPRGEKKTNSSKYTVGGGCLIAIIAVIWFPLVLFALGNTVGKANPPTDVTVSIRIGAYAPIYQYTAQQNSIKSLSSDEFDSIVSKYWNSRTAQTFLSNYLFDDVAVVVLPPHSTAVWTISPPDNLTLVGDLQSDKTIPIRLDWTVTRQSTSPENPPTVSNSQDDYIQPHDPNRKVMIDYLEDKITNKSVKVGLPNLFPKFVKITNRGTATPISQLMAFSDSDGITYDPYRRLLGAFHKSPNGMWWEVTENCSSTDPVSKFLEGFPYSEDCDKLVMYTFNDKAFPATLSLISGKGIIGLYTTFVIVIHSVIRGFFTGISFKIMFDDMPCVDRLLQLCLDIYLVRESRELDLEEDLFAKLVFLYRSPETLIKWTRPPEEIGEDENEDQPDLD